MASIRKRGENSYRITVSVGYDYSGKKITESKTVKLDSALTPKQQKKELERLTYEFEQLVKSGAVIDSSMTFKVYADMWLKNYAEKQLERKTLESYRSEIMGKIVPSLGNIKLKELGPLHLLRFYDNLTLDGVRLDGKPGGYSTRTIKYQHQIISSMLQTAVHWRLVGSNIAKDVRPPKGNDAKKKANFLDEFQAKAFLEYVLKTQPLELQALALLAAFGGLRKGEIMGLTWADIDFDTNTVDINKAMSRVSGEVFIKSPKNKSSVRKVTLPDTVIKTLKLLKSQSSSISVLTINYDWPTHWYKRVIKNYNAAIDSATAKAKKEGINNYKPKDKLPEHTTFHGLRHTSATLLIAQGLDIKTVSARLGHNNTSTTLNIYSHAIKSRDEMASDALDSIIGIK